MELLRLENRYIQFAAAAVVALAVLLTGVPWAYLPASAQSSQPVFFREDFDSLERWSPMKFKRIRNMSTYTLDPQPDKECYVKATSNNSASWMFLDDKFNVYDYPMIRWRWKVSNVYSKGNAMTKRGDDYPLRISVMFMYDPEDPHVKKNFKYGLGKRRFGKYPPYTSLIYIWANREHEKKFIPSPYVKEYMMVPLRSGAALAGQWLEEERNILDDYREAFGTDPPAKASLAFMNDSDNTGESSESWIDWIEVYREREPGVSTQELAEDPVFLFP